MRLLSNTMISFEAVTCDMRDLRVEEIDVVLVVGKSPSCRTINDTLIVFIFGIEYYGLKGESVNRLT